MIPAPAWSWRTRRSPPGSAADARATITAALAARPDVPEVLRAARALAVALPLDEFRVDGRATIRAFEAVGSRYAAPAVMVLDRAVMRVFPGGTMMALTHQIVRVDSKDAVARWGEVAVPAGAEILTLRTHKRDGSTREPEEIDGKETISAADVAIGDYIEWEYLETRAAVAGVRARVPGRSVLLPVVRRADGAQRAGAGVAAGDRAGARSPRRRARPADAHRGGRNARHDVPGGRRPAALRRTRRRPRDRIRAVGAGVERRRLEALGALSRRGAARRRAIVARRARAGAQAGGGGAQGSAGAGRGDGRMGDGAHRGRRRARPIPPRSRWRAGGAAASRSRWRWRASSASRRARCWRVRCWSRTPARRCRRRSWTTSPTRSSSSTWGRRTARVYVDPRLRHAAFGYLPPGLDGARILTVPDGQFALARKTSLSDGRSVDMVIRLDEQGGGTAVAVEQLAGWPALEWAEMVDRFGADRARLRQDFEQRWLGVQFPGAHLRDLDIELPGPTRDNKPGTARIRYTFSSTRLAVPSVRGGAARRSRDAHGADVLPFATRAPVRGRAAAGDGVDAGLRRAHEPARHRGAAARRERQPGRSAPRRRHLARGRLPLRRGARAAARRGPPDRDRAAPGSRSCRSCASRPRSTAPSPPTCAASTAPSRRRSASRSAARPPAGSDGER